MDQVRPHHVQRYRMADRASLDWPADPYQTPSGGGHRADRGQKRDTGGRIGLEGTTRGKQKILNDGRPRPAGPEWRCAGPPSRTLRAAKAAA